MIQKQSTQHQEQKRTQEFNSLDLRNFLEEISKPTLLTNFITGQIISVNSMFTELANMGYIEIVGSNIFEFIPSINLDNCSDGEILKTKLIIKNNQSLDVEVRFKFVSQNGNLNLMIINSDNQGKKANANAWENLSKAQNSILDRISNLNQEDLIQELIKIGKLVTLSDEVIFYIFQEGNSFLKRFPNKTDDFPEQIPALEMTRIKEIDIWEPGKRVLSEIHRVGRLHKLNSIISIPILSQGQNFGLIILAKKNPDRRTRKIELISNFAQWITSVIELKNEINQKKNDYMAINEKAEEMDLFFNNSNDCLLLLDKNNKIIEFNSNFLELFEFLPVEILDKNFATIFGNSSLESLINDPLYKKKEPGSRSLDVYNRHGIKKSVLAKLVSFGFEGKEKKLVILNDKTEIQSLENNILNLQKNAALGELLAEFSHDVRNIINRMTTGLQLLIKKNNPDESVLSSLIDIQNDYLEISELMESVLSFSRQNYENFKSENIKDMVERIFYKYQKKANLAKISLILNLLNGDFTAWCDQRSLERVVNNLINNGVEAIGENGGAVSVNLSENEEHPGFLVLQIADTGPGIPPEIQSNLYQKFISGKSQGTGLGLYISKKIIEYHKGWIKLDTFPGGTIFNIYLPKEKRGNTQ